MAELPDDNAPSGPPSPMSTRRPRFDSRRSSVGGEPDERSPLLLGGARSRRRLQQSGPESPKYLTPGLSRNHSTAGMLSPCFHMLRLYQETENPKRLTCTLAIPGSIRSLHHSRNPSLGQRLSHAFSDFPDPMSESKRSIQPNERVWYDQFTSTDWVHDNIIDAHRVKALKMRKDFRGRSYAIFDASQGWILSALCGFVVALVAYVVNLSEATVFDYKYGYCARGWYISERVCFTAPKDFQKMLTLYIELLSKARPLRRLADLVRGPEVLAIWRCRHRIHHLLGWMRRLGRYRLCHDFDHKDRGALGISDDDVRRKPCGRACALRRRTDERRKPDSPRSR